MKTQSFWAIGMALFVVASLVHSAPRGQSLLSFGGMGGDRGSVSIVREPGFYVSVEPADPAVAKLIEDTVRADGAIDIDVHQGPGDEAAAKKAYDSGDYREWVSVAREADGTLDLTVRRWMRANIEDTERVGWKIAPSKPGEPAETQRENLRKTLQRYLHAEASLPLLREMAVAYGTKVSDEVMLTAAGDYARKSDGVLLDPRQAFNAFVGEKSAHRHWWRMLIEVALLFGVEDTFYYTVQYSANQGDFEYDVNLRSQRKRWASFEGWHLDDNNLNTNAIGHPIQGTLNYLFARSNGFKPLEAFAVSFTASLVWELVGEVHEAVSVNDVVVTPGAAFAIGEAFWQLGQLFERGKGSLVNRVLLGIFGGPRAVHNWIDKRGHLRNANVDELGLDASVWHSFRAYLLGGSGRVETGIESEIIRIPDVFGPGKASELVTDGAFSRLVLRSSFGKDGLEDFLFNARAAIVAYHRKSISPQGNGYSLILALTNAYEYGEHRAGGAQEGGLDRIAVVNIAGPTIDLTYLYHGLRVRAVFDVYGDFAMLRSYAFEKDRSQRPDDPIKATLAREKYYHALGVTASGRLIARYGRLSAGVEYQRDLFDSIEGMDRYQAKIDEGGFDVSYRDERRTVRGWAAYAIPLGRSTRLNLNVTVEDRRRSGEVRDVRESDHERVYLGGALLEF